MKPGVRTTIQKARTLWGTDTGSEGLPGHITPTQLGSEEETKGGVEGTSKGPSPVKWIGVRGSVSLEGSVGNTVKRIKNFLL